MRSFFIAYALVWLSVALAVVAGLYFTKDIRCLWFLVLPLFISVSSKSTDDEKEG